MDIEIAKKLSLLKKLEALEKFPGPFILGNLGNFLET